MKKQKTYKTTKKATGTPLSMKKSKELVEPLFDHDQLLVALYYVWDAFERANMGMCVVGSTALSVMTNMPLVGDKIEVAVRKNEWESGSKSTLLSFAPPTGGELTETGEVVHFGINGIPILLYVLESTETIQSPNVVIYHSEYFKFPNPYSRFLEEFPQFK